MSSFGALSPGPGVASLGSTHSDIPLFAGESSLFIGQPTPVPVVNVKSVGKLLIITWNAPPAGRQIFAVPGSLGPNM